MSFNPISYAVGIGVGEAASRIAEGNTLIAEMRVTNAEIRVTNAMIERNQALEKAAALQAEIQNKWMPYGICLKSSIMANRVQKADLSLPSRRVTRRMWIASCRKANAARMPNTIVWSSPARRSSPR